MQSLARQLEQPEIKDWLANIKDMLMGEKSGKDKEDAAKKLTEVLERYYRNAECGIPLKLILFSI